jgi:Fe-S cluster biogenesis protein NfuA
VRLDASYVGLTAGDDAAVLAMEGGCCASRMSTSTLIR